MTFKPKFDATINLGHVLVAFSFLCPAIVYGIRFATDFKLVKLEVSQHSRAIEAMNITLAASVQNQAVVTRLLEDHLRAKHILTPKLKP